jgi:Na+/H+-dicarboxylate symporter
MEFSDTVRVMKAVSSHMVLTFCSRSQHSTFSVLMSRTRRLPHNEVRGVNNMLTRRGLALGHVKEMCKGAAACVTGRLAVVVLLLAVQFLSSRH